jgi:hypothetical protein
MLGVGAPDVDRPRAHDLEPVQLPSHRLTRRVRVAIAIAIAVAARF